MSQARSKPLMQQCVSRDSTGSPLHASKWQNERVSAVALAIISWVARDSVTGVAKTTDAAVHAFRFGRRLRACR